MRLNSRSPTPAERSFKGATAEALFKSELTAKGWKSFIAHRDAWYWEWTKLRGLSLKTGGGQVAQARANDKFNFESNGVFVLTLKDLQDLSDYNKKENDDACGRGQKVIVHARILITRAIAVRLCLPLYWIF